MITLRAEQVQVIASAKEEAFLTQLACEVRKHFPALTAKLDGPALRTKITAALERAKAAGVTSERDCVRLVNVAAALEWRLEDHPWLDAQLADPAVDDVSERVRLVVARALRDKQREEQNRAARRELERATRR
ncbi:MAG TPA: hypothetical protein VGR02_00260 [Thermoanaerobaculia bacterium]|nr:hypothetical protein [Thermoanaerobaculia bacterium]